MRPATAVELVELSKSCGRGARPRAHCRRASGASWRFRSLPAGLVGYVPVRIVRAPSFGDAAILILAAIAYTSFAVAFFGRGLQRYASGSGFTMFG